MFETNLCSLSISLLTSVAEGDFRWLRRFTNKKKWSHFFLPRLGMNNYCEYTVLRVLEVRSAFRFPIKREETNQTDGIKKKSGDLFKTKIVHGMAKTILWTHRVENTLKLFDTYLFFILFRRFLLQLAYLLLDALQHRVRANGSLNYAFRERHET